MKEEQPTCKYLVVLNEGRAEMERFETDDLTQARKRIVDFVGNSKDRKGVLHTEGEGGYTWYDYKNWHYD